MRRHRSDAALGGQLRRRPGETAGLIDVLRDKSASRRWLLTPLRISQRCSIDYDRRAVAPATGSACQIQVADSAVLRSEAPAWRLLDPRRVMVRPLVWLLATLAVCPSLVLAEDGALYLRRGANPGDLQLLTDAPTRTDDGRESDESLSNAEAANLGNFATLTGPVARHIPGGPVSAYLFLGTGKDGMDACADVTVTLLTVPAAGGEVTLASVTLDDTTLEPKNEQPAAGAGDARLPPADRPRGRRSARGVGDRAQHLRKLANGGPALRRRLGRQPRRVSRQLPRGAESRSAGRRWRRVRQRLRRLPAAQERGSTRQRRRRRRRPVRHLPRRGQSRPARQRSRRGGRRMRQLPRRTEQRSARPRHDGFGDPCDHCPAQTGRADGCPCTWRVRRPRCVHHRCLFDGGGCQHSAAPSRSTPSPAASPSCATPCGRARRDLVPAPRPPEARDWCAPWLAPRAW